VVALGTVVVGLALSLTAAYAFSRYRFAGRRALMMTFLLINMFPLILLIIPLFITMRVLGILDTHIALILAHSTFSIPFATWMMTSYFDAIPRSLAKRWSMAAPRSVRWSGGAAAGDAGRDRRHHLHHLVGQYLYASVLAGGRAHLTVAVQTPSANAKSPGAC
jgi:multiple sugar transport system permease protein